MELVDSSDHVLETRNLKLGNESNAQTVEFRFRPEQSGVQGFHVRGRIANAAMTNGSDDSSDGRQRSIEFTELNNRRSFVVDRGRGPYDILYVSVVLIGSINSSAARSARTTRSIWCRSFVLLKRNRNSASAIQSRFRANPLFSGFEDVADEDKEQYNEPVFARLGVTGASQLKTDFLKRPKSCSPTRQSCWMIWKVTFYRRATIAHSTFRYLRGGGLLFLGGQESMRGKSFRESVLAQLLPIYGDNRLPGGDETATAEPPTFRFDLTREGCCNRFLRTEDTEEAQRKALQTMPPMFVLNDSGGVKPGAAVLVEAVLEGGVRKPALATQRFGKGRTAALLIGDLWRAALHHKSSTEAPLIKHGDRWCDG